MAVEVKVPELGENITSGDVVAVPVAVGDSVSEGQTILEVEAGKASIEIPSPVDGTVAVLHIAQGDSVAPGQLVLTIDESGLEDLTSEGAGQAAQVEAEPEPEAEEQFVDKSVPVVEPESVKESKSPISNPQSSIKKALAVSAAPGVRKLARELGVDVHLVPASGPLGHITVEDVKEFARSGLSAGAAAPASPQTTRVEKMSAVRKATMKHMAHCWATIPHVTHHDTADITELEVPRKRYAPKAEAVGAKLTMTAMLIKVIASALKVHPKFNCSIDPEKGEILYKEFYNIGIAMDTPRGLLVPVIRDGDKKNMVELAVELKELADKARDGKIEPDDMKGGTFTFTNIGIIGGTFFTPIVNSPEVAILGSGRAHWQSCPDGGEKRFKLPLSLSYDHRIIDGADGARFLKWVTAAIQDPLLLSLEG